MDTTDNNLGIEFAPRTFSEYVGNYHVVNAIMAKVASGSLGNAILLSGYTGVGKTTLAMLIERVVNCQNPIYMHQYLVACKFSVDILLEAGYGVLCI
jgi:DNA polymerase III gamma/tau subunit